MCVREREDRKEKFTIINYLLVLYLYEHIILFPLTQHNINCRSTCKADSVATLAHEHAHDVCYPTKVFEKVQMVLN